MSPSGLNGHEKEYLFQIDMNNEKYSNKKRKAQIQSTLMLAAISFDVLQYFRQRIFFA